ncbi:MAG: tRNA 2-thiouridine(34) synthase MnmA [Myxococcales bacterium]|nr:MAG: tRNA 2-thiouridine(34) synthase MnmA [Myxococcales bacterium]
MGTAIKRVLVAMSGGVDSSLAAAVLKEQGYDLVGVTLHLWDAGKGEQVGKCCAPEDRDDARRSCDHLGIPHYVLDERKAFRNTVVDPFLDTYIKGRTPIPCVSCNQHVKLTRLLEVADAFGASHVATGHYVRLQHDGDKVNTILRGRDYNKDQSYFLFGVPSFVFERMLFPLGELTKDEVRKLALKYNLPNATKPESQSLCFVPDGDIGGFVDRQRSLSKSGTIVDENNQALAEHDGVHRFTVGQRKGLGLGGGKPRYVLRILPEEDKVVVGERSSLGAKEVRAEGVSWLVPKPEHAFRAKVRIRYRHEPSDARVQPTSDGFIAEFDEQQFAITPGQAAVIYKDDAVLAGGYIA